MRRPQEEAITEGPIPYEVRHVRFANPSAGTTLAGDLRLPRGYGPFPAVVLVSGTGPNTRDEDVDGHKVFLVLADVLVRRGVAVLSYDKRGVGGSSGRYGEATTADFASDAASAVRFLRTDRQIDARRIGMLGHSEGGVIAPMVAADDRDIAFVVLMAAPGLRGGELFALQAAAVAKAQGAPSDYITRRKAFDDAVDEAIQSAASEEEARMRVEALVARGVADKVIDSQEARGFWAQMTAPWNRYFLRYDPAPALARVTVPVLAVIGSLDTQVPATENLSAIRKALRDNQAATVVELPGLNHLLQTAHTGSPDEYTRIEETISPSALRLIADWIAARR